MNQSPITCTVDLSAPGKNVGFLHLPYSPHRSAYGQIPIPIASLVGPRPGPSVLLIAGNHGDEYEGQVILSEMIRTLDPSEVGGQITLLPMANFPAAEVGSRVSPLDGGNLNRCFPGVPLGNPTEMIAYYIEHVLMPGIDMLIDIHSGGSSLYCLPFAMTARIPHDPRAALRDSVLDALGFPAVLRYVPNQVGWYSTSAAMRAGAMGFTLELGGAGTIDPKIRSGAQIGLLRALKAVRSYWGIIEGKTLTRKTEIFEKDEILMAGERGVFESFLKAGQFFGEGQLLGLLHRPEDPGLPPHQIIAEQAGYVLAHRVPARTVRGDGLFHVGYK